MVTIIDIMVQFSSVQSLSRVQLFAILWYCIIKICKESKTTVFIKEKKSIYEVMNVLMDGRNSFTIYTCIKSLYNLNNYTLIGELYPSEAEKNTCKCCEFYVAGYLNLLPFIKIR